MQRTEVDKLSHCVDRDFADKYDMGIKLTGRSLEEKSDLNDQRRGKIFWQFLTYLLYVYM